MPSVVLNVPASHATHSLALAAEALAALAFGTVLCVKPRIHTHSSIATAPVLFVCEFAGHALHEALESVPLCVNTEHRMQLLAFTCGSKPGLHMQSTTLLPFVYSCVLDPSGHAVQLPVSCKTKKPAVHALHVSGSKTGSDNVVLEESVCGSAWHPFRNLI